MHEYLTVSGKEKFEFTEKKSRFIGWLFHVESAGEAQQILSEIKKEYWDASHNCSAYITGENMECMRFSDDGEPQGTAGVPMLEALKQSGLTDVLAVATRYFGGILLGAGGLVRAYTKCVSGAVDAAYAGRKIVRMVPGCEYRLVIPYSGYGRIENMVSAGKCIRVSSDFGENIDAVLAVREDSEQAFLSEISEAFLGSVLPERLSEKYIVCPI